MKKFVFSVLPLSVSFACVADEFDIGFDSKYVSEGRNNLSDGGILWATYNGTVSDNLSFIGAYGRATDPAVDYDELVLTLEYAQTTEQFDYYVGYSYLAFFEDDARDHEITFGAGYNAWDWAVPFADFIYSTEATGAFVQIGLRQEYRLASSLWVTPYALVAYDYGYISEPFDGQNHSALGATFVFRVDTGFTVTLLLEQTFAGNDVEQERGDSNQTWAGLHFTYSW